MTLHWGTLLGNCSSSMLQIHQSFNSSMSPGIGEEVDLEDEVNDDDEGEPALVMTALLWAKVHSARQIPVITQIGQI